MELRASESVSIESSTGFELNTERFHVSEVVLKTKGRARRCESGCGGRIQAPFLLSWVQQGWLLLFLKALTAAIA